MEESLESKNKALRASRNTTCAARNNKIDKISAISKTEQRAEKSLFLAIGRYACRLYVIHRCVDSSDFFRSLLFLSEQFAFSFQ